MDKDLLIFPTWIAEHSELPSKLHTRWRLCPETKPYPAAHPDRLFLDMTGLAQLLPGTSCCLETETEAVNCYLPPVTHSSKMTFTSDCRHDDYDCQVNVSLPCYMLVRRRLLPFLFCRGSLLMLSPSSFPLLQVCCEWKSGFAPVINQVGPGCKKVMACAGGAFTLTSRWKFLLCFKDAPSFSEQRSHPSADTTPGWGPGLRRPSGPLL